MRILQLLFTVQGRLNRSRFWNAVALFFCLWFIVLMMVAAVVFAFGTGNRVKIEAGSLPLILAIPIGIRRLHDRDKSGWWLILFYALPAVLTYFDAENFTSLSFLEAIARIALSIWAFLELGCLRGTPAFNRFGPDPLAITMPLDEQRHET